MPDEFDSVEEIDGWLKKAIRNEEDETKHPDLRAQAAEYKSDFFSKQLATLRLNEIKRDLATKYPLAAEFSDTISGGSAEELELRYSSLEEKLKNREKEVEKRLRDQLKPATREAYGRPVAAGAGGTDMPVGGQDEIENFKGDIRRTLERGNSITRADATRYGNLRINEAVQQARENPTYRAGGPRGGQQQ